MLMVYDLTKIRSSASLPQNAIAVIEFQKLEDSLAPSGTTETQSAASSK
jgi:hypothetical protein